ncbi:MAG TPA: hypothetical protein VF862_14205, partial [Gemmatimonadales bacterium]
GTHGRSIWILDDLTPIRTHASAIAAKPVHLYPVPAATQWHYRSGHGRENAGPNPPRGVTFSYWLKSKPTGPVSLQVLDGRGTVIRTLSSEPEPRIGASEYEVLESEPRGALAADSGMRRATWDFAHRGADRIRNGKIDSGDPSQGPQAVPGTYSLRMIVGRDTATATAEVRPDPRDGTSQADREAQLAFALEVRDQISRVTGLVERLRQLQAQLGARADALGARADAAELVAAARSARARARALEAKLHNPDAEITYDILAQQGGARVYSRLSPLLNWASDGTGAPTQGMREVYAEQRKEVDGVAAEIDAFVTQEIAALNVMAGRLGIGFVVP